MDKDYWSADLTQIHIDIINHVQTYFLDYILIDEIDGGFEMLEGYQDTYFKCISPIGHMLILHVFYNAKTNEIKTNFVEETPMYMNNFPKN